MWEASPTFASPACFGLSYCLREAIAPRVLQQQASVHDGDLVRRNRCTQAHVLMLFDEGDWVSAVTLPWGVLRLLATEMKGQWML